MMLSLSALLNKLAAAYRTGRSARVERIMRLGLAAMD
jgi:hypothetical protein